MFFKANDGFSGDELWVSDGTPGSERRVRDLCPGPCDANPSLVVAAGDHLLFFPSFFDGTWHTELWQTDGTREGTVRVSTLDGAGCDISDLAALGGKALFLCNDVFLWVTDGTAAGTRALAVPSGFDFGEPLYPTGDGRAFLVRQSPTPGLWITDGTEAGTYRVEEEATGHGSSGPLEQAALGEKLLFSAVVPDSRPALFVTDGTAAGTGLLDGRATWPASFFRIGDRLLFSAAELSGHPFATWVSDGTPAGTARVSRSGLSLAALLRGQILFGGSSGFGNELMKIDGRLRKVELVKDIDPFIVTITHHECGPESSRPAFAGVVGGRLLFAADDGRSGRELWATDGTRAGTVGLRDINPGRIAGTPPPCFDPPSGPHRHDTGLSSDPRDFVLLGSVALFSADDGARGREPWAIPRGEIVQPPG